MPSCVLACLIALKHKSASCKMRAGHGFGSHAHRGHCGEKDGAAAIRQQQDAAGACVHPPHHEEQLVREICMN